LTGNVSIGRHGHQYSTQYHDNDEYRSYKNGQFRFLLREIFKFLNGIDRSIVVIITRITIQTTETTKTSMLTVSVDGVVVRIFVEAVVDHVVVVDAAIAVPLTGGTRSSSS
jgi:hypothetical protein